VSADEQFATGRLALLRPALRQYAEHEPDAFDRLLLPTLLSTTSTRAAFVPSISSRLAPRPFALGLHPGRGRLGDLAVQDAKSASAGGSGFSRGVSSSACSQCYRASDTPVADPWPSPRLREARFRRASRDRAGMRSVKSRTPLRSRMPSIASLPRHARVAPTLENGHVRFPLR